MYKLIIYANNNIKECDIIKALGNMMFFATGAAMGVVYKKYEKDIMIYMQKMTKTKNKEK